MKFPKGKPILENVKIHFVNFDNIINQAKKAREGRLNGYIQIIYPQEVDLLFFKQGNPINAGRYNRNGFSLVSIKDVVERAKSSEIGIVNIYDIPDELLFMMIVSLKEKPLFSGKPVQSIDKRKLIEKLKQINFGGFLVLIKGVEYYFVKFGRGEPVRMYLAGKHGANITGDLLLKFLEKESEHIIISAYEGITQVEQAQPALISLYIKFLNNLVKSFSNIVGKSIVNKTLLASYDIARNKYNLLNHFTIGDDLLVREANVVTTTDEVTAAFASWIDKFVDSIFVVLGRETDQVVYECIKDYRFALKSAGFFEKSKLKRLDI